MSSEQIVTVLLATIGALTGTRAWDFWKKRMEMRRLDTEGARKETHLYRDDLRERLVELERKLDASAIRENELLDQIRALAEASAALKVRVEFLEKENHELRDRLKHCQAIDCPQAGQYERFDEET